MDHLTDTQKEARVKEAFKELSNGRETITREETMRLLENLGLNIHHDDLPEICEFKISSSLSLTDLLHDAGVDSDDKIDIDNVITIINHISKKDEVNVIYDEPDENQLNTRLRQLHIKVQEMLKNGVVINQQTYDQLCQECGVSNNIDLQH